MANERRQQERFNLELQARISYSFVREFSDEAIETVAANISSGGAFLATGSPLPLSSKVQIEFLLGLEDLKKLKFILPLSVLKSFSGDKVWVKATGVVIRQEEGGVAVIFNQNYQVTPLLPVNDQKAESA